MKRLISTLALGLAAALAQPALAHDDATLDAMHAPHGGQLRMAGAYHFELVLGKGEVSVYLSDHGGQQVSADGASGNAIILAGGKKTTVALAPTGGNRLSGKGDIAPAADTKAVVTITFPGGQAETARFTPKM